MNMPKDKIQTWCDALRSGEYKQTKGALQDSVGFCCLGVAIDLFNPKHPKMGEHYDGGYPRKLNNDPKWLIDIDEDTVKHMGISLADLNDESRFTFDEIADVLEAVYIHEVMG